MNYFLIPAQKLRRHPGCDGTGVFNLYLHALYGKAYAGKSGARPPGSYFLARQSVGVQTNSWQENRNRGGLAPLFPGARQFVERAHV